MHFKNILALFALTSLASAAPAEDITGDEGLVERAPNPCPGGQFCCDKFVPFNFWFIEGVGSGNCYKLTGSSCGNKKLVCCKHKAIVDGGDVVCTA
ncbi:hypothetical protein ASPWEDRAFT_182691 [Aspergillus wentii DTO 134E9]|uniref:Hydrophobin n=1 Tax=Aspergillus wentii DTO 134E9 TaxID=1073089 RepID=A0A1L9RSD1_ASPWE|nr:uncharacterized protein ASPWEDRAFT_182691 [Aspergillus wentii DTO 134E9]KAI9930718.1 hypothetical protein MW887_011474 [Aspergillus wentii]OJJ37886.1 hypothetical protein ASPWEDRAFT_182691 [Aspergillus wentii DTO 134E9]